MIEGDMLAGVQALILSVLVPDLWYKYALSWEKWSTCFFPHTKTQENFLSKCAAPGSICDLVIPYGRSPHCRAVASGLRQGQ